MNQYFGTSFFLPLPFFDVPAPAVLVSISGPRTISTQIAPRPIPVTNTSVSFGSTSTPISSFHGRCGPTGASPSPTPSSSNTAAPRLVLSTVGGSTSDPASYVRASSLSHGASTTRAKRHARSSSTASAAGAFCASRRGKRGGSTRTMRRVDCSTTPVVCVSGSAVGPSSGRSVGGSTSHVGSASMIGGRSSDRTGLGLPSSSSASSMVACAPSQPSVDGPQPTNSGPSVVVPHPPATGAGFGSAAISASASAAATLVLLGELDSCASASEPSESSSLCRFASGSSRLSGDGTAGGTHCACIEPHSPRQPSLNASGSARPIFQELGSSR